MMHRGLGQPKRVHRLLFALSIVAALGAGAYLVVVLRERGGSTAALSWAQLANTTYPSDLARAKQVTLHDGAYEEQLAPGSASKLRVRLADIGGFGKIGAGDKTDAAVVLISSGGGSGTFIHLVAVLNQDGTPRAAGTVLLGDRVAVRGIVVRDRNIVVRMRVRGASEPFASLTREVTRTYSPNGDQLVLQEEVAADVPSPPPSQFNYKTQTVTLTPVGNSFSDSGVLAAGESESFIVHAEAGQRLKVGVTSEFNNAVLSIQGLSDLTQLVSRTEFASTFDGPIPSSQDYSVRVVSLAGSDLKVAVSMKLTVALTPTPLPARPVTPTVAAPPPTRAPNGPASPALPKPVLSGPFRPRLLPFAGLAPDASDFAQTRSQPLSVALGRPADDLLYSLNGDTQLELASVVKVLIMAAVLGGAEQEGRFVDSTELGFLWPMITESDNDAATALWNRIGGGPGLTSYLKAAGFGGITPYDGAFWGTTTASANALVGVLSRMFFGDLLRDEHRKLALELMESVTPEQRWGITAATDASAGDEVAIKDGWFQADGGWRVNSVGVVLPADPSSPPYVLAALANLQPTFSYGVQTLEGIAQRAGARLSPSHAVGNGR